MSVSHVLPGSLDCHVSDFSMTLPTLRILSRVLSHLFSVGEVMPLGALRVPTAAIMLASVNVKLVKISVRVYVGAGTR